MTAQPKSTIKSYFETGDKPNQSQFVDFIDSYQDTSVSLGVLSSASIGAVGLQLLSCITSASAQSIAGVATPVSFLNGGTGVAAANASAAFTAIAAGGGIIGGDVRITGTTSAQGAYFNAAVNIEGGAVNINQSGNIVAVSALNLVTATGNYAVITGNTTITNVILSAGCWRWVRFAGTPKIQHDGINLFCPGNSAINTAVNDFALFIGEAGNVVRVAQYQRQTVSP